MVSFSCVCDTIFVCPTCVCETIYVWAVNRLTNDTCSSFFPFSLAGAGAGLKTALHRLTASSHCKLDLHRLTASSHKRKCKLELHRLTNASRTIVSQTQVQLELLSHTRWRVHRRRSQDRRCPVWVQAHIMPRKPLLHCCCTAAALLLHCCCTAAALLLHCCCTAAMAASCCSCCTAACC